MSPAREDLETRRDRLAGLRRRLAGPLDVNALRPILVDLVDLVDEGEVIDESRQPMRPARRRSAEGAPA